MQIRLAQGRARAWERLKRTFWKMLIRTSDNVVSGHTTGCGRCNDISAAEIVCKKFGSLRIKEPQDVVPGSHRKIAWACDCGQEKLIDINSVLTGRSKSCGTCAVIPKAEMANRKFGHLRMKRPSDVHPSSPKKRKWACDCGGETDATVAHVTSGHTNSCGRCWLRMRKNYESDKDDIRKLRTPIAPEQLPDWCPIALEPIIKVSTPFRALCRLCGKEYAPRWDGIRLGRSLTCGCTMNRVSSGQQELFEFLRGEGAFVGLEHTVGGLKYDMLVNSSLLLEYNGLHWHPLPESKNRDLRKYKTAINAGYSYMAIFEDEWASNRRKVQSLILNRIGHLPSMSIRASECKVREFEAREADAFHSKFHYIGACRARMNYALITMDGNVAACMSFKRPTRQSKHDWELVRMTSDPQWRVHGAWTRLLRRFIRDVKKPVSIVSFSDNRLFTGRVYEHLGFELDGNVRQDYYWWKNKKRFHKSALRKPKEETDTEVQIRLAQGYARVWDLGKKRWVLRTDVPKFEANIEMNPGD